MEKEGKSKSHDNSFGIAAVILGILSIIFSIVFFGLPISIIGFIFALKQRKVSNNNWAKWALALNIIGFALSALVTWGAYNAFIEAKAEIARLIASGEIDPTLYG